MNDLTRELMENADKNYKAFSEKLIPSTKYPIIGVRVPIIKSIAVKASKEIGFEDFLSENHTYYEEYFLHGLLIGKIKDFKKAIDYTEKFLPYIDNWAINDSFSASFKSIKKHKKEILPYVKKWITSDMPYTIRFGIIVLLDYFIKDDISEVLPLILNVKSEEYYVNMAISWFLSTAFIYHREQILSLLQNGVLNEFIHKKTIQKAIESYRISEEDKKILKLLKNNFCNKS